MLNLSPMATLAVNVELRAWDQTVEPDARVQWDDPVIATVHDQGRMRNRPQRILALRHRVDERVQYIVFTLRQVQHLIRQVFIGKTKGSPQSVLDQVFGKATGEVPFPLGDELAHLVIIPKSRPIVKCSRGVDLPSLLLFTGFVMVCSTPLSGSIEVFQSETDRVDLAVAIGALSFFHMGGEAFAGGEDLVVETRDLRDVRRRGRRRIVQQMAKHQRGCSLLEILYFLLSGLIVVCLALVYHYFRERMVSQLVFN